MEYNFPEIEAKWRKFWADNKTFKAEDNSTKPKFYVLDMFPYPSGAGLHVGHPLGYIASDIYARYKRLQGFNVLHPMGYDSFGLPAEQYAIQTGQHPALTTVTNIDGGTDKEGNKISGYRKQLDIMGFSFDWDREVRTSSPEYYKWTQWIFKQLYNAYYDTTQDKAVSIDALIVEFSNNGNGSVNATTDFDETFTADQWKAYSEEEKEKTLQQYRLTYLADSWVNWCPALGTVLANDEVVSGVSERGGHPVEQKLMRQWSMRIKAYAERLLTGLETVDWTDSIKDQQRNWIGKSVGASVHFKVDGSDHDIEVFTTRPDTIYGVSFMVLAPEHPFVDEITTAAYAAGVANYKKEASLKSERDRMADVKNISGQNTGAFALHPFTGEKVQIWIGDYVLASYGTGAVMAVPCGDQRDWDFAKHFGIDIINIFKDQDISEAAYAEKDVVIANSDFLNDLPAKKAIKLAVYEIEKRGFGQGKTQYRLRDAVFSRQRYWGEPFPVYYKGETPYLVDDAHLPITLPEVDKYLPTEDGEPPLARAEQSAWNHSEGDRMEFNTMPGWAGSSWYFLRYMDPKNENEFVAKEKVEYWKNVDLYIGGSEHATGHLLYSRFWTKFLYDLGYIPFDEPFQKMINQGMILGRSSFAYRAKYRIVTSDFTKFTSEFESPLLEHLPPFVYYSYSLLEKYGDVSSDEFNKELREITLERLKGLYKPKSNGNIEDYISVDILDHSQVHVDISLVENDILDIDSFTNWKKDSKGSIFLVNEDGTYICGHEVEKMSKSKYNVQTPDELVEKYGADTLRMYEMFLGPLEQSKPWDTKGISGVHNFLRKLWRLFHDADNNLTLSDGEPDAKALKSLHKTIKKIGDDLDRFSFNTGVSNFMICVNELGDQKCNNKAILQELVILLSSYAPHVCEELWVKLGNEAGTLSYAQFPEFKEEFLVEANHSYPVSFNGKMRFMIDLPTAMSREDVEKEVLAHETAQKWLEGNTPKKVIVVPGKIVNVVV
ncbi:MAG: class I tRNA ligase family protein [Crocinitomicaceae bacterium]|nr:class I tRNA ligase family protein [Crocinitomicaceae bacterium]